MVRRDRHEASVRLLPDEERQHRQGGHAEDHRNGDGDDAWRRCFVRLGLTRAGEAERYRKDETTSGLEPGCRVDVLNPGQRLPCGIEREAQIEAVNRSGAIGKRKIMVEPVVVAGAHQNLRELVSQHVGHRCPVKRRVGQQPAAPSQRPGVGPGVIVDAAQRAILLQVEDAAAGHARDADERKALPGADVERALAAIPVAGEYERLCLGDVKAPWASRRASTSSRSQCSSRCASARRGRDSVSRTHNAAMRGRAFIEMIVSAICQ